MSDPKPYENDPLNYLIPNFKDFNGKKQGTYEFNVSQPVFEIAVMCSVGIFPSDTNSSIRVEIDADDENLKNFAVSHQEKTIIIEQNVSSNMSNSIFIGNNMSVSGININIGSIGDKKDISIVNDRVFINGKEVAESNEDSQKYYEPKIRIFAPYMSNLDAQLKGSAVLASAVPFLEAEVETEGSAKVGFTTYNLDLQISGSGKGIFIIGGGSVKLDISGSGNAQATGNFGDARINISGSGEAITYGNCTGNYRAVVSGIGTITHHGTVGGRIKKSISGMGSISINI